MDFRHSPEVLSFLSRLGHTPDLQAFVPGEDVVKVLKQLRRSLYESETGREARTLLEVHSIANHLVPLLAEMHEGEDDGEEEERGEEFGVVVLEVSKILVLLTLPDSPLAAEHCRELRQALSLPSSSAMSVLVNQIRLALSLDASKRTPEQKLPMDLLFWLVRNLLVDSSSANTKDVGQFFLLLEREFVLDVCLHFAKHVQRANNREWDVLFLEIFYHVFSTTRSPFDSSSSTTATVTVETKLVVDTLHSQRKAQRSLIGVRHSNFNDGLFQTEDKQFVSLRQRPVAAAASEPVGVVARKRLVPDTSAIIALPTPNSIFTGKEFVLRMAQEFIAESEGDDEDEEDDSAYASLFASLIQCIQKEDARFQAKDEIHFLWLVRYFPVHPTTSTLWCFTFVLNKVYDYLEAKAWVSLELAVQVLFHLLTGVQDKAKLNLVFYELRQRLEIVPKLIRMFDRSVFSLDMLRTLCLLGNFILLTLEDMAVEGAVSKAKQKKARVAASKAATNSLPFGVWNAEEMRALDEGVESFHGECSLAVMRQVLKHPTLGAVFEKDKTPNLLLGQCMHIRHQKQVGKTLEQIVQEALDVQNQLEREAEAQAEAAVLEQDPLFHETVNAAEITEKKIDFVSELRTYLSNFVFHALSQLVDPGMYDSQAKFLRDSAVHDTVALFFRRLRLFRKGLRAGESLEPLLWHVANFACWRRTLQVFAQARVKNPLTAVLDSTLRRFFRLAQANRMLFVEVLFWRTKAENLALLRDSSVSQTAVVASKPAFLGGGGGGGGDGEEEEEEEEDEFKETSREPWSEGSGEAAVKPAAAAPAKRLLQSSDAEEEEMSETAVATVARPVKAKKERNTKKRSAVRRAAPVVSETGPNLAKLSKAIRPYHRGSMTLLCAELEELEEAAADKGEGDALVLSVDTRGRRDLCRILLLLGMRPPNRNLATKGKDVFACEAYWRCPSSCSYKHLASVVRECVEANKDDGDGAMAGDSSEEEYAWCLSEDEQSSSSSSSSSGEEEEEEEETTAAVVLPTKKRRIVLDSDEEDDE